MKEVLFMIEFKRVNHDQFEIIDVQQLQIFETVLPKRVISCYKEVQDQIIENDSMKENKIPISIHDKNGTVTEYNLHFDEYKEFVDEDKELFRLKEGNVELNLCVSHISGDKWINFKENA